MRVSEVYTSTQGEGPNTGHMIQFVRFAGCNMRCPGWPCDTPFAIEPSIWKHDSEKLTPEGLFNRLAEWPKRICLTGGEPFLQHQIELQEFVEMCLAAGYQVECFTNGSFEYPHWARASMVFIMDWKLEGSGEAATAIEVRRRNALEKLSRKDSIKFVVKDQDDLREAYVVWQNLRMDGCEAQFWVGAAWGSITNQEIVEFVQEHELPWRLNVQVHKMIWAPDKRGV